MKNISKVIYTVLVAASIAVFTGACAKSDGEGGKPGESGGGQGGSMARFTIVDDFLYTVDNRSLNVVSISDPKAPKVEDKTNVGWGIETIYPFGDYLMIGSTDAMYIYDISVRYNPKQISRAPHFISNDPVVAIDDHAYVTLSGNVNTLIIYNIADIFKPREIRRLGQDDYVKFPRGLGVDGDENKLFVCDRNIVNVYDITDRENPQWIGDSRALSDSRFDAYDLIVLRDKKRLLVTGADGFYQFDYSQGNNLVPLGKIKVNKEE